MLVALNQEQSETYAPCKSVVSKMQVGWPVLILLILGKWLNTIDMFPSPSPLRRSDSEILGYALDTLYNIICNDEEEEQGIWFTDPFPNYQKL